jgi:hypothetical protein
MSTFKEKRRREVKITQLILLEDPRGPFIVASRGFKKKIAIFSIHENIVSHFKFTHKVLKIAAH